MSRTRAEIKQKEDAIIAQVTKLRNELSELEKEGYLLSDEEQWFTEEMEEHTYRVGRKKVKGNILVGRIHWIDYFTDEDTGEKFPLERSRSVRKNGEWDL